MADGQQVVKSEPADVYPRSDWVLAPRDPENLDAEPHWHQVMEKENLRRIAQRYGTTWQKLAVYNWGTAKPAEVNWYLESHCGCSETTPDGKNYVFGRRRDYPSDSLVAGLWVPVKRPPTRSRVALLARRELSVLDSPHCRNRSADGKCTADMQRDGQYPDCMPPGRKGKAIPIGKRWGHLSKLIAELLNADNAELYIGVETVGQIHVTALGVVFEYAKEKPGEPDKTKFGAVHEWDEEELESLEETETIKSVAQHLRILEKAGVLRNLVVHGYADRRGAPEHNFALSERRAQWVVDELQARFGLHLDAIPVKVIGCGEALTPEEPRDNRDWRVAVVDVNVDGADGAAAKGEEKPDESDDDKPPADELVKSRSWTTYELRATGSGRKTWLSFNEGIADFKEEEPKETEEKPPGGWGPQPRPVTSDTTPLEAANVRKAWDLALDQISVFEDFLGELYPEWVKDDRVETILTYAKRWLIFEWSLLFPGLENPTDPRIPVVKEIERLSVALPYDDPDFKKKVKKALEESTVHLLPPLTVGFKTNRPRRRRTRPR